MISVVAIWFENRWIKVVGAALYVAVLAATVGYLLHHAGVGFSRLIVFEAIAATAATLVVGQELSSASTLAWLAARDLSISVWTAAGLIALGLVLGTAGGNLAVGEEEVHGMSMGAIGLLFAGLGAGFGARLRHGFADLARRALLGKPRFYAAIALVTTWFFAIMLALVPAHVKVVGLFVVGAAGGVLVNKGLTLRLAHHTAVRRRLFEVNARRPATLQLSDNERTALDLLCGWRSPFSKRLRRLREHLEMCRSGDGMSSVLRLVSACAFRLEGRYADAIDEARVASEMPRDSLEAQLLLVRAMAQEDLSDEAGPEIDELLGKLGKSPAGAACPLTRALQARRAAERAIDERGTLRANRGALDLVLESLELRRLGSSSLEDTRAGEEGPVFSYFRGFVAHGVPVTQSWLLDVLGYSLVVAGFPEEGRILLEKCIAADPAYSYGYLHLGDCFLLRRTAIAVGGRRAAPRKSELWHAKACYLVAKRIEGQEKSRVRRLASRRLALLEAIAE